jgi:hypothetical protein
MSNGNESTVSQLIKWAKNNPLPVATFIGGAIYVLVFESYRSVLRPFGVTPADVGIDYTDVIWPVVQSIGFIVFCLAGIAALAVRSQKIRALLVQSGERQMGIGIFSIILIIVVLSFLALSEMAEFRNSAKAGRAYDPFFSSRLQVLAGLRANRVKIAWKNIKDDRPPIPTGNLLFFGAADGVSIFYSNGSGEILRIPSHDIVLTEIIAHESRAGHQPPTDSKPAQ